MKVHKDTMKVHEDTMKVHAKTLKLVKKAERKYEAARSIVEEMAGVMADTDAARRAPGTACESSSSISKL